eukprot:13729414-Alexandrium_andersonii.AAC.1
MPDPAFEEGGSKAGGAWRGSEHRAVHRSFLSHRSAEAKKIATKGVAALLARLPRLPGGAAATPQTSRCFPAGPPPPPGPPNWRRGRAPEVPVGGVQGGR